MMKTLLPITLALALLLAAAPAQAAKDKDDAARQAARQHDAKVLSVKEQNRNKGSDYKVKVLTKEGVVKTVRVPKDEKKDKN